MKGHPKLLDTVTTRIEPAQRARVRAIAQRLRWTESQVVREVLAHGLEALECRAHAAERILLEGALET